MPPARRARLSSRPYSSVAAEEPSNSRGWLSVRRSRPSKRARRGTVARGDEDDGTPLTGEILVGIFAGLPDLADLVRCAATCRRWRRLVSGEAAFICRASRRRTRARGVFVRSLALGFFYAHRRGAAPRFAPMASASRRLGLRQPTLNALVEDLDDGLLDTSRLVASRNGLLVFELQHGKHALKLCVCNPMTGEVAVLPPLSGKDGMGSYVCTVVTADDYDAIDRNPKLCTSYCVVLVYGRRAFTACRSYSPDDGSWGPECTVTNASGLMQKRMTGMTGTGVAVGNAVYWRAKNTVFRLRLDTLQSKHVDMPVTGHDPAGNTLLGVSPDGRLRVVQILEQTSSLSPTENKQSAAISVVTRAATDRKWEPQVVIPVARWLPAEATCVKLRWVCEKSGVVFFAAGCGDQRCDMYALSLDRKEVEKVASHHGGGDPLWRNLHGYEMDHTSYLASLAMDEDYT